ncbi:hypothetical protein [Streptomyces sp. NPDC048473]|uniref:hypothetical protein n=1 Tax=unclassified Streptomyces TaxID=2593676 RepID=UPI003723033D
MPRTPVARDRMAEFVLHILRRLCAGAAQGKEHGTAGMRGPSEAACDSRALPLERPPLACLA